MKDNNRAILAFFSGIFAGATIGILLAPDKGSNTRKKITDSAKKMGEDIRDRVKGTSDDNSSYKEKEKTNFEEERMGSWSDQEPVTQR